MVKYTSADIDGNNATSYQIDKEDTRLGKYSTTKRVARSIFLGTAPLDGRGLDMKDIIRSAIQPGETLIHFKDAISKLSSKGTYIHGDNVNFWFSNEPSINSLAKLF